MPMNILSGNVVNINEPPFWAPTSYHQQLKDSYHDVPSSLLHRISRSLWWGRPCHWTRYFWGFQGRIQPWQWISLVRLITGFGGRWHLHFLDTYLKFCQGEKAILFVPPNFSLPLSLRLSPLASLPYVSPLPHLPAPPFLPILSFRPMPLAFPSSSLALSLHGSCWLLKMKFGLDKVTIVHKIWSID